MAIVTYIPRVLPLIYLKQIKLPLFLKRFLSFVPYTVLASLIFPGILYSVDNIYSAVIGGLTALLLSFIRVNLVLIVLGGILAVILSDYLFLL